ncbi:hypothetical protein B9479_008278 [Cryptococcus floricola]|uniref:Uncharacterized protein n=1 Tax=Cryptococcus floricola TaxID=2591691 RepID=A0A5D3AKI7_9TREE|nr:hypothetical protein B9479_008278 [Cryptococcus floricola]
MNRVKEDRKTLDEHGISHIDAKGTCFRPVPDFDLNGELIGIRFEALDLPDLSWNKADGSWIKIADRDPLGRARIRAYSRARKSMARTSAKESETGGGKSSRGRTHGDPADGGQVSSSTAAATMSEDDSSLSYELMLPEYPTIVDCMTADEHDLLGHGTEPYMFSDGTMMDTYPAEGGPDSVPYSQAYHDSFQQQQQ